jgi:hypothetical protein
MSPKSPADRVIALTFRKSFGMGGGLFARGIMLRLLAGQRRLRARRAFYVYAYPEPAGYGDTPCAGPEPSTIGTRPVHPAVPCRAHGPQLTDH